jgi:polygalacturonase
MNIHTLLDYNAVPDGKTKNTTTIARAIESCAKSGGGRVLIPPGIWLTGPIELKSNIDLHLAAGANLLFSRDFDDYPLTITDYEGQQAVRCTSPIWGNDLRNVSITGDGVIDGSGDAWRPIKRKKLAPDEWKKLIASGGAVDDAGKIWYPTVAALKGEAINQKLRSRGLPLRGEDYKEARDALRPNMVKIARSQNIVLDGPTFKNSAAWNVHLLLCENVTVNNVKILNDWNAQNGDALDMDSCKDVTVKNSFFDAGDDAICIKSGKDEAGRARGVPCENITIENCTVLHGHGGVTIGSEMSGGVRNVRVSNCLFRGTDIGLRFKTTRGRGGVVENIDIANIVMYDIRCEAISLNMYYWISGEPVPEPVSERTPTFRDFTIRNVVCHGANRALEIRGLPEMPVERIHLENIRIKAARGAAIDDAKDISIAGLKLDIADGAAIECRKVRNLKMEGVDSNGPAEAITERVGDL